MKEMIDVQQLIHIIRNMKPCFLDGEMSGRITFKGDIDFATEADFAVQRQVQERLLALYPDIQFMGEEKDNSGIDFAGAVWILDPVDGTTNLIHQFRRSAISRSAERFSTVKKFAAARPACSFR